MNLTELQRKLTAAARANPPSERVPYAFEQRILARVAALPNVDHWALWARGLWKAVAPCAAIMLLLAAWSYFGHATNPPPNNLAQDFENTVLAAADQDQTPDSVW